jgi:hypothetical protein
MNKEMMSKGERDEFHRLNRNTEKTLKRALLNGPLGFGPRSKSN